MQLEFVVIVNVLENLYINIKRVTLTTEESAFFLPFTSKLIIIKTDLVRALLLLGPFTHTTRRQEQQVQKFHLAQNNSKKRRCFSSSSTLELVLLRNHSFCEYQQEYISAGEVFRM